MTRILIVEDEALAARRLAELILTIIPAATILNTLDSIEDTVVFFRNKVEVDLVFMDIHLSDGNSFEIFKQVDIAVPVIFTTAFDHYAVKAFRVNGIDYLLKPVVPGELAQAIEKFERLRKQPELHSELNQIIQSIGKQQAQHRKRFLVKSGSRLVFIRINQIAYFLSEAGTTFMVLADGQRFITEQTLEDLEQSLDADEFFRINRKLIVCSNAIKKIEPYLNGRILLELSPEFDEEVLVSRNRSTEFRQWLDQ